MGIFDALFRRQQEREAAAVTSYAELVATLAAGGDEPSLEDVERLLADAGKTLEELAADVDLAQQRAAWKQSRDQRPNLVEQLRAIGAERKALDEAHEAAEREYRKASEQLQAKEGPIRRGLQACDEAEKRLRETAPDDLRDQLGALKAPLSQARKRRRALQEQLRELSTQIGDLRSRAAEKPTPAMGIDSSEAEQLREQQTREADSHQTRADRLKVELEEIDAAIAKMEARLESIRGEQLV